MEGVGYQERNQLVALLSAIFEAHLYVDLKEPLWPVVCIHTPCGQMSWHVPMAEIDWFSHLEWTENDWDGHTTEEKYRRLKELRLFYANLR